MKMKNILKYIKSIYFLMYKSVLNGMESVSFNWCDRFVYTFIYESWVEFCVGKMKCQCHTNFEILTESKTHIEEK